MSPRARFIRRFAAGLPCLAGLLAPAIAHPQGTARIMDIDPSVISAGMAGASTGVFWTAEPNQWANPALLGYHQGIRWQWGSTNLTPELADVMFETNRWTLAGAGVGFQLAGKPVGAAGIHVDYGDSDQLDPSGNPTTTLGSFEEVDAMGLGVSLGRLIEAIAVARGSDPPAFVRHFDFAMGWAEKHTLVAIAPGQIDGEAEATSRDMGFLARAGTSAGDPGFGMTSDLSVDISYGYGVINYDDATFEFGTAGFAPPTRQYRNGFGLRILGGTAERDAGTGLLGFLAPGLDPALSVGLAYDRVRAQGGDYGDPYYQDLLGLDVTLYNVASLRVGRIADTDAHAVSFGAGVGLPIGDLAAVRYDFASYPIIGATDLPNQKRHAGSIVIYPLDIFRAMR